MRDYQTKSNVGGVADSITAEKLGAGEANSTLTESKTAVSSSGQTLAPADGTGESTDQLAKALAIYGAGGAEYCIDTGAADAYVLNPVSPKKAIPAYFDGMKLTFMPGNINTGGGVTINYAGLGVKSATDLNGDNLIAGDISGMITFVFNLSSNRFELVSKVFDDSVKLSRSTFETNGTTVTIGGGAYVHFGTSSQILLINSALTFTPGPGGSNPASSSLGASEWHYIYIDDSAVVSLGSKILTAAEFLNSTTAPTYSPIKKGWYNGNDRCVFAFRTTAGSAIDPFWHDGGDYVQYDAEFTDRTLQALSNAAWTTVTITAPTFCKKAKVSMFSDDDTTSTDATTSYRTFGSSGNGHSVNRYKDGEFSGYNQIDAILSSSQQIEIITTKNSTLVEVATNGYHFPTGM